MGECALNDKQLDKFMEAIQRDEGWRDFFYTELTIGLRCGELCGLKWEDFDEETGTLKIQRTVHVRREGALDVGEPKTGKGNRKIVLPATTAAILRERKKTALTEWIFPPAAEAGGADQSPLSLLPYEGYLEKGGTAQHPLPRSAAYLCHHGPGQRDGRAMLGHVSAATTLDIYTHVTDTIQTEAAAKIDQGIGKAAPQEQPAEPQEKRTMTTFQPYIGKMCKPGTGYIGQKDPNLWEGRYSPTWINGKKHARNVYTHTREECEKKLKVLIVEMKAELAELKQRKIKR